MEGKHKIGIAIAALGITYIAVHMGLRKKGTHNQLVSKIFRVKLIDKMYKDVASEQANILESADENKATQDGIIFR